jgi:hypothetical protein
MPASAQYTRDKAASEKIDEAINQHYLVTDFDKAEGVLLGTVQACEDKCRPATVAKAWMYVGIVRGSGRGDQAGAKEAFSSALSIDPNVKLDEALATPDTKATFAASGGQAIAAAPAPVAADPGDEPTASGTMTCSPQISAVQTRMPIPVSCLTEEDATQMEIRYKEFGGADWKTLKMSRKGDEFRAEIPCPATELAGTLQFYVRAKDAAGDTVDNYGSKSSPVQIQVQNEPTAAPAYPGEAPPARCEGEVICPPDFPGCKNESDEPKSGCERGTSDWGASCDNSSECKEGLLCMAGSCETAPSCAVDEDCPAGVCLGGKCDIECDGASAPAGPYRKNWFGLHAAQDFAFIQGENVCSSEVQPVQSFACYDANTGAPYPPQWITNGDVIGDPYPGTGIGFGSVVATTRVLLSYERAITPNISLGARLGYAFRGGPPSYQGRKFFPFHAEARIAYFFGGGAFSRTGLRPYLHLGGGMAQVDGKQTLREVLDCSEVGDEQDFFRCIDGSEDFPDPAGLPRVDLDAWKKLGQGFVTAGLGVVFAFSDRLGVQANVNGMYMFPAAGPVVQPSLGMVFGF